MRFRSPFARPRRADRTWLPAVLAVLLAVMVALQLFWTDRVVLPEAGPVAERARPAALADPGSAFVAPVIARRPIFAPRGAAEGRTETAGPADPLGGAILFGTVRTRRGTYAVVRTPDGVTAPVAVGGTIAGWRLVALSASGAQLARGSERLSRAYGATPPEPGKTVAATQENPL